MGNCRDCRRCRRVSEASALSRKTLASIVLMTFIAGCFGPGVVPVSDRTTRPRHPVTAVSELRVVQAGDTLYSIAFERGLDYRTLAAWNGISPPYLIKPGQRLRLTAPRSLPAPAPAAPASPPRTPIPKPPAPTQTAKSATTPKAVPSAMPAAGPYFKLGKRDWIWPAEGKVIRKYSARRGNKGIDIAGQPGQTVRSAAPGRVVYAGSGLRGYGRLIIVKHNETFLSAYAHNRKILVSEGSMVTRGQQIAEMGRSGTDRVKLHFEIRRRGVPVDPLRFLPPR